MAEAAVGSDYDLLDSHPFVLRLGLSLLPCQLCLLCFVLRLLRLLHLLRLLGLLHLLGLLGLLSLCLRKQDVDRSNKPRQAGGVLYRQQMKAYSHDELLVKHADLPPKQVVGLDRFGSGAMMEPTITRNLQTSKHKETIALDIHHETLVMG